jgi:hypothetical protein
MAVTAAFPYIEVTIDTSALQPVAQRSPGVLAVVGATANGAAGGTAAPATPTLVTTLDDAAQLFSKVAGGVAASNPLFDALKLALLQDPKPSTIYGVRVDGGKVAEALASLDAAADVTFVVLAGTTDIGTASGNGNPATGLLALKEHVESISADGNTRIGVAAIDPTRAKSPTYAGDVLTAAEPLRSSDSRMIVVAARGSTDDVAVASAAAIAGLPPNASIVLKRVRGISIPVAQQYGPSEIRALSEGGIVPIIDPALVVGSSLHFADGRCFTSDDSVLFVDVRRILDDATARLKAGLIGLIGDARITRSGLVLLRTSIEGILGPLQQDGSLDSFAVRIPALEVLNTPEATWSPADKTLITTSRANRSVGVNITAVLAPAAQRFEIFLAATF